MKILAIRGANLASLAREFEVDLARGALGGSGLFAIVGNTGAGKSTLLDALCVALFDRTPRFGERTRHAVLIGRGADDATKVSAHDVRAILRRGAGRGFAEVDFQGDDGRRYRARWEVHRARDKAEGALQTQEMSLRSLDDAERLGGTRTETLAAIEERLGLSFDQFRRSALLAQGDFAAFLRAEGKDRSELLERMTGTEIYSQLSIAAHRRGQLAEQRIKELGLSMTAIEVLSDEALAQLRGELAQASACHDEARRAVALAERAAQWWQQRGRLAGELELAERELAAAAAQEQAAGSLRHEHELRRRAETLRPAWQAAQQATRLAAEREQLVRATAAAVESAAAAASGAQQARQRIEELLAPVREVREAIRLPAPPTPTLTLVPPGPPGSPPPALTVEQLAVRVGEPVAWLGARRHLHGLAAAWPEIQAMEERDAQLRQTVASLERAVLRLRGEADRLLARRALLEQERQRARAALDEATRRAAVANAPAAPAAPASAVPSLDTASRHEDAARRAVAQAAALTDALTAACAARDADAEAEARQAQGLAAIALAEADLARLEEALRLDAAALAEAEAALARLTAAASLAHARAHLVPGDPCPLCGAVEHPWAGRGAFDELIVEQAAAVAVIRARRDAADAAALERKLELAASRLTAENLVAEREALAAQRLAATESWTAALVDLGELMLVADPLTEAAALLAAEHAARARRALEKARDERRRIQALSNAAAEAAALLLTKRHDLEQVDTRVTEVERERQELEDKIIAYGREIAAQRAVRLELAAALATRLEVWAVSREALELEPARVFEELRVAALAWRRHVDKLHEHEAALLWHQGRAATAAAAAESQLTGARANLETYQRQHREARAEQLALTAELERAAAAAALDAAQLAGLMSAPADRGHQLGELLAELDRSLERARSVIEERRRALAEHERARPAPSTPAGDDAPPTPEKLLALRQRAAAAEEHVLTLRARLERDEADRLRRLTMNAQVLAAEREGEIDRALAQAIGSHDGKLLRAFAQSLTLDTLLELANHHLDELAPRYQLERVPRYDLELQVIDRDMGDEVRAVQSLSGGESFLVSLALALALSALAAGSVRVRTLLIDEGFGTLDPATLDGALAVLDALQATGRQVGVISHIPGLLERVGAHVKVVQRGSGRSDVIVAS